MSEPSIVSSRLFVRPLLYAALAVMLSVPASASPQEQSAGGSDSKTAAASVDQPKTADSAAKTPGLPGESAAPSVLEGTDLGRMLRRDMKSLPVRQLGPVKMLDVQGTFRNVLIVQTAPDGKPTVSCIADQKAAEVIFAPKSHEAPRERKEP